MSQKNKIIYTLTDESPLLATYSLLPIIHIFTKAIGINIEIYDISLAARIIAMFPEKLTSKQYLINYLAELSKLIVIPEVNIIKLPNISASLPQLRAAIKELQEHGYDIPSYINIPKTNIESQIKIRYDKIMGSAVNPILRIGNSIRRSLSSVKNYARANPHKMNTWLPSSRSHVACMQNGDFYSSEKSVLIKYDSSINIHLINNNGNNQILKSNFLVNSGDIVDAATMNKKLLQKFIRAQIQETKKQNVLLSVHLKSTMMKISDPIIFGIIVAEYYKEVIIRFNDKLKTLGFNSNNGIGDLYAKIKILPDEEQQEILQAIEVLYQKQPKLAMVNVDKNITNLHVPSDVIIDASMSAMIRNGGKMLGPDGYLYDTKAIIPDRCYAGIYQAIIDHCKRYGAFDPTTIGSVSNVGLMAYGAEEYGSQNTTFQISNDGIIQIIDDKGNILLEHYVESGDIWRMCRTKDLAIQNWVKLAVQCARELNNPAIFWLDPLRPHDVNIIDKINCYLQNYDTNKLDIRILSPISAMNFSVERMRSGYNTISVTGNVLRDYLTDLFPIIELGTSAKMLSIIPLIAGGAIFETGAGGSAPKHFHQFIQENHLRWDSLGEFLALMASLKHFSTLNDDNKAKILAQTLDTAINKILNTNKFPSRAVGTLDNRGSHFYLALFWAQALAEQGMDKMLKQNFSIFAKILMENEQKIIFELNHIQGNKVELGGYYHPDPKLVKQFMRPSVTFNNIINNKSIEWNIRQ